MNDTNYWRNKWVGKRISPPNTFARRAFELIKKAKGPRTLVDVGCGDGRDSIFFSERGLKVTALDLSESGIEKLKGRDKRIKCVLGDIRKHVFPPDSFDVVYAHLSLHYFDDHATRRIFKKLFRVLRRGGLIFVKCKATDDPLFGKGEKVGENMYRSGHTRHFFTTEYMRENLKDFEIIRVRKTRSSYDGFPSAFIEAIASK